jgi:competence protein ComGC
VPAAHSAAARSAFAQSERSTQQSDAAFGIVAPLSAILVVSVIGNLVLPSMAKKLRAAEESA